MGTPQLCLFFCLLTPPCWLKPLAEGPKRCCNLLGCFLPHWGSYACRIVMLFLPEAMVWVERSARLHPWTMWASEGEQFYVQPFSGTPMSQSSTKLSLCEVLPSHAPSSEAPIVVTKVLHPTVGRADLSAVPCAMRCARLVFPHPAAASISSRWWFPPSACCRPPHLPASCTMAWSATKLSGLQHRAFQYDIA